MEKKQTPYAFKDKSQLPGPRCIASQEFSIKVLFFFKFEYYLRSQEFFINYSMLQIFHKINTDKNQPADSSSWLTNLSKSMISDPLKATNAVRS